MPSQNSKQSKTPTSIKIAAKEASKRATSAGGADPGPGDPSAAPSEAPQLVDIPNPPTPSELVVKSTNSRKSTGSSSPTAVGQLNSKAEGSVAGPAGSVKSMGSAHEATSSKPLTGPSENAAPASGHHSLTGSHHGSVPASQAAGGSAGGSGGSPPGAPQSAGASGMQPSEAVASEASPGAGGSGGATASAAMQAESGAVHEDEEVGEGEVEQPETPASPGGAPASGSALPAGGLRGTSQIDGQAASPSSPSGGVSGAGVSGGVSGGRASGGVSGHSASGKAAPSASASMSPTASSPASSAMTASSKKSKSRKRSTFLPSGMDSSTSGMPTTTTTKDGKKVTKFRYHKRITVRTSGKTNPTAIMDKVNKKDHKAGITPSTIEDMDPQELMRRAGIKGSNKTHWRVRLRQTKRLTKNGKTVSQTKVAYRDSEGNKRVKTSSSPFCKNCGKKLEDCKCDASSHNSDNQ